MEFGPLNNAIKDLPYIMKVHYITSGFSSYWFFSKNSTGGIVCLIVAERELGLHNGFLKNIVINNFIQINNFGDNFLSHYLVPFPHPRRSTLRGPVEQL